MDAMNDTQSQPTSGPEAADTAGGPDEGRQQGPRVTRDQILDTDRLRRTSSGRLVAGVAGGLGRHFDVDPLLFRIAFVALTFTGGAGLLLYAALWLFLPADDGADSPVRLTGETRRFAVIGALALAGLVVLGDLFTGSHWIGWPLALVLLVGVIVVSSRDRDWRGRSQAEKDAVIAQAHAEGDAARASAYARADELTEEKMRAAGFSGGSGGSGTTWEQWPPPRPPMKPRRTGLVLFWPTLALIAIGLGVLAMYDASHPVADGAYPALALTIVAVMLVVGAFVGRAGGLILLGLLTLPPLLVTTVIGNDLTHQGTNRVDRPATAAEVTTGFDFNTGSYELDLTELDAAQQKALDGHHVTVNMKAGDMVVRLPRGLGYHVDADLDLGGQIDVEDHDVAGPAPSVTRTSTHVGPVVDLDLHGKVGRIAVVVGDATQSGTTRWFENN